jgi:hypothetical protein
MRKNPRRILSPQRLPFRHPGDRHNKSNEQEQLLQHCDLLRRPLKHLGVGGGINWALHRSVQPHHGRHHMLRSEVKISHNQD